MIINLNILVPSMKDEIGSQANAKTLSHQSIGGIDKKIPKSLRIILIQLNSTVVVAKTLILSFSR